MNKEQAIKKLTKLFKNAEDDDYSEVDQFVDEQLFHYEGDEDGELDELAFRIAIRLEAVEYVREHVDEIDLYRPKKERSYSLETKNKEILSILDYDESDSWDDYADCKLVIEALAYTVLFFQEEFQREVFDKYLELAEIKEEDVIKYLQKAKTGESGENTCSNKDLYSLDKVIKILRVREDKGELVLKYDYPLEDSNSLKHLVESLGWEFSFDGGGGKCESSGVFYIE